MRLPRDLSGLQLARLLAKYGYEVTRKTGGHKRLTTKREGEHHITIPIQQDLRVGTFSAILNDVAGNLGLQRNELVDSLFG